VRGVRRFRFFWGIRS